MIRPNINEITSDQLDALYQRLDNARDAAALHRQGLLSTPELYAAIEADPNQPPAPTPDERHDGPSVAECAQADASHWTQKYAGEEQTDA